MDTFCLRDILEYQNVVDQPNSFSIEKSSFGFVIEEENIMMQNRLFVVVVVCTASLPCLFCQHTWAIELSAWVFVLP